MTMLLKSNSPLSLSSKVYENGIPMRRAQSRLEPEFGSDGDGGTETEAEEEEEVG